MDRREFLKSLSFPAAGLVPTIGVLSPRCSWAQTGQLVDYGFAPGGQPGFDLGAADYLSHRPNTCLVQAPLGLVSSFVGYLKSPGPLLGVKTCGPVVPRGLATTYTPLGQRRQLVVATHASNRGTTKIGLDLGSFNPPKSNANTEYEDVVTSANLQTILIPANLMLDGVPLTPATARVRIAGCRLGDSLEFLLKLKEALGNSLSVTAANHMNGMGLLPELDGWVDFLEYNFEFTATEILSRDDVVFIFQEISKAAFDALEEADLLGDPEPYVGLPWMTWYHQHDERIPDEYWDTWIPKQLPDKKTFMPSPITLMEKINGINSFPTRRLAEYRNHIVIQGPLGVTSGASKISAPVAEKHAWLKTMLERDARFLDTHAYPFYKRYGKESIEEFIDSFVWYAKGYEPNSKQKKEADVWFGYQVLYSVIRPLTDKQGRLIYNYVGKNGRDWHFHLDSLLDDSYLFTTV